MKTLTSFVLFSTMIFVGLSNIYGQKETKSSVTKDTTVPVLTIVEVMPSFVGGEQAMYEWLGSNIKYPQEAREKSIAGNVIVQFIVESDGSISGVQILKDIGGGCGDEAVRVVKAMPKWNPGRQNEVPVRVLYTLPIKFTLN